MSFVSSVVEDDSKNARSAVGWRRYRMSKGPRTSIELLANVMGEVNRYIDNL